MRSVLGWLALAAALVVVCVAALLLLRGQPVTDAKGLGRPKASPVTSSSGSEPIEEPSSASLDREPVDRGMSTPEPQAPRPTATLFGTLTTRDPTLRGPFELALAPAGDGPERARTVEVGGPFRFEELRAGTYRVSVREPRPETAQRARGWASWFTTPVPLGETVWEREVELPPGETQLDVVLGGEVLESCRLTGWLFECSSTDMPVQHRVEYVVPNQFNRDAEVASDGAFDLGLVPPGTGNLIVSCMVEGVTVTWYPLKVDRLDVEAGEERSLELPAPCFAVISTRIVGLGTQTVLDDAVVQISSAEDDVGSIGISLKGDKKGILPEGAYWAAATAKGYRASLRAFEVAPTGGALELVFELERADDWIVQLVDRAGRPLADARVLVAEQDGIAIPRAIQPTTTTDKDGNMAAGFLEPKRYGVRIAYGDFLYESTLALDMGTPVLVIEEIDAEVGDGTSPR